MLLKRIKRHSLILLTAALVAVSALPAQAAETEATVTSRTVSQGINASDQYVYDGSKTDFTMPSLVLPKTGISQWGYVDKGRVQNVNGLYPNWNGWWLIENGWVNFNANGILKAGNDGWFSLKEGKRQFKDHATVMNNANGWWYLQDGKVNFDYTGFARNDRGLWYVTDGKVDFSVTDVIKDTAGVFGEAGAWYYVKDSQIDLNATTIAQNSNGWWKITNGKVDFDYTGVARNENGYWLIKDGKVNFDANGWYQGFYFQGGKAVTRP